MGDEKFSIDVYKNKIQAFLNKNGKKPLPKKELAAKCRSKKGNSANFIAAINELKEAGIVCERKKGFLLCENAGFFNAEITRLQKTFGFARKIDDGSEIFIPGKFLMGAMPGDTVLVSLIQSRSGSPEGEVVDVLKQNNSKISGTVVTDNKKFYIIPDTMSKSHIRIADSDNSSFHDGDKVLAEICSRGLRHADHKVRILMSFGNAQNAQACADALLAVNGIETVFPVKTIKEAKKISENGIQSFEYNNRLDLRNHCIFTIDGAESKDLDDAVSIQKNSDYYTLGVHIADVSYYVKGNSELDKEAMRRGTSVYYADKVVPMLPQELSNGICSLNPNEDRLTFSCIMKVGTDGKLISYEFKKSIIRSNVKGVYSEVNQILAQNASETIKQKYSNVIPSLLIMNELADILISARKKRGAPDIDSPESKLLISENGTCTGVVPRTRGKSEMIIEEFMLLANQSAANFARLKQIPFVYRIHEKPSPEKIFALKETLTKINVEYPHVEEYKPSHMSEILLKAKDNPLYPVINNLVLRAMSKAKYSPEPIGHFGLALNDYAHFTSPIRRYPDLSIHRILTDAITGYDPKWMTKRYEAFAANSSEKSSNAELRAMTAERDCEDCYKAEYMLGHIGETFEGIISSVTEHGFYVMLDNTVEGLVHINSLPAGNYSFDGFMSISDELSGKKYSLGDKVSVICSKASVSSGDVDFELCNE